MPRPFQTFDRSEHVHTERTMTTSQIRIKAINRVMAQRLAFEREEQARLTALSMQQTQIVRATDAMQRLARETRPMLALDTQGRPYFMLVNGHAKTEDLIKEAVKKYFSFQARENEVILLSPLRFLSLGAMTHYRLGTTYIPIGFENETFEQYNYDVMVRGE